PDFPFPAPIHASIDFLGGGVFRAQHVFELDSHDRLVHGGGQLWFLAVPSKLLLRFWLWRGEPCAAFLALRRPGKAAEPLARLGCPPSAGPLGRSGGKRGLLSFPQPPLPVSFSDGMFFRSSSLAAFRDEPRPTRNRCFAGKLSHCPQPLCSAAARAGYVFQLLRFRPRRDPLFLLEPGFAGGRAGSEKPGGSGFFGARDFCSLLHMPFASDA